MRDEGPSLRASFTCGHLSIDLTPRGSWALGLLCVDGGGTQVIPEQRSGCRATQRRVLPELSTHPRARPDSAAGVGGGDANWGVGMPTGGGSRMLSELARRGLEWPRKKLVCVVPGPGSTCDETHVTQVSAGGDGRGRRRPSVQASRHTGDSRGGSL